MSASPDVVWQVIKNNNCFLRKGSNGRNDPIFSAEKGNLYNKHSFKFSGELAGVACATPCVAAATAAGEGASRE